MPGAEGSRCQIGDEYQSHSDQAGAGKMHSLVSSEKSASKMGRDQSNESDQTTDADGAAAKEHGRREEHPLRAGNIKTQ